MEKINIDLKPVECVEFVHGGNKIAVKRYIPVMDKSTLISGYTTALFQEGDGTMKYMEAELGLVLGIIELCTNIDIGDFTTDTLDNIIGSGLWDAVKSEIKNYSDLRKDIENVIARKDISLSMSLAMSKIFAKLTILIESISELDLSESGIRSLMENLNIEKEKLNDIIPVIKTPKKRISKPKIDPV